MLKHQGQERTYQHNLKLAVLLSTTAGLVNIAGFYSFTIYTTNVTGHVAHFAKELSEGNFYFAKIIALWMLLFFLGAFFSNLISKAITQKSPNLAYTIPIFIEIILLLCVGYIGEHYDYSIDRDHFLAGCLLFAMGMQNAIVSVVSGFVVRTTHLTGLFTDLGIELSQLFFSSKNERNELNKKIVLHGSIVLMFILGGIIGGILHHFIGYKVFILAASVLVVILIYDNMNNVMRFFQNK
ncbi:MAG: DUF1275 domain-containing protein [Bacteroidia bacterium]|nr:DUF1275 domain-containing protein [Bacteroidia bacterium]